MRKRESEWASFVLVVQKASPGLLNLKPRVLNIDADPMAYFGTMPHKRSLSPMKMAMLA
jgi:hypothetical protein